MRLANPDVEKHARILTRRALFGYFSSVFAVSLALPSYPAQAIYIPITKQFDLPDDAGNGIFALDFLNSSGNLDLTINEGALNRNYTDNRMLQFNDVLRLHLSIEFSNSDANFSLAIGPDIPWFYTDTFKQTVDFANSKGPHSFGVSFNNYESGYWRFDRWRKGSETFGL